MTGNSIILLQTCSFVLLFCFLVLLLKEYKNRHFSEHKFAVEIDKKGNTDKNQDKENETQTKIEKRSYCKFFHRINPDAEGFDILRLCAAALFFVQKMLLIMVLLMIVLFLVSN